MTIPPFEAHGALPPFVDGNATSPKSRSPYPTTMGEVVDRFCFSESRARLLKGFNEYRRHLYLGGFVSGMQWIDGSFLENVEATQGRSPRDIDVVTLFNRPLRYQAQPMAWPGDYETRLHWEYFETREMKPRFSCDTYCIDMDAGSRSLIRGSTYWFGLFSDMRGSGAKKGIIEISLPTDPMEFLAIERAIGSRFNV